MVIVLLSGGLGNLFYQYSYARSLAHKLNTELKLDLSALHYDSKPKHSHDFDYYNFDVFNTLQEFATPEEIKRVKENGVIPKSHAELKSLLDSAKNFQGDIYVAGFWMMNNTYYFDIIDVIRKEFTLNRPFNPIAESWRQKILAAECAVSMHFRHGDYVYHPDSYKTEDRKWASLPTFDYYHTCIDILKQRYNNLTVFVFSNNIQYVKENLRLDVPTKFVEGCETDEEEWLLISTCKHNIAASSTFSNSAAYLNANPDKKMFSPTALNAEEVKKFHDSLTPAKKDEFLNVKGRRICIPFDFYNQPKVTIRPFFSLLLVVNENASTIAATLDSLLKQDYRWHEVIIIDNASTDGSNKICKDAVAGRENIIFKKLYSKVTNADAWNMALDMAQGRYVSFLKGGGIISNALTEWYWRNAFKMVDILISFEWLEEDGNGNVNFAGKKYSVRRDAEFKDEKRRLIIKNTYGRDAAKLLMNQRLNGFMGTKIYNREFLLDNGIRFDEQLADDKAELFFQMEAFSKSKYFLYTAHACCVVPKDDITIIGGGISI